MARAAQVDSTRNTLDFEVIGNKEDTAVTAAGSTASVVGYLKSLVAGSALAAGTEFWIKKTVTSSAIVTAGLDLTGASSGGALSIEQMILQTDGTGLAGATAITIATNNAKGILIFFQTAVSGLGANKTVTMLDASVTKIPTVLESGKKLTINRTVADGTGAGTVDIYIKLKRLDAGATIAAA